MSDGWKLEFMKEPPKEKAMTNAQWALIRGVYLVVPVGAGIGAGWMANYRFDALTSTAMGVVIGAATYCVLRIPLRWGENREHKVQQEQ